MRRWSGWGDETVETHLSDSARNFLRERVGAGTAPNDVALGVVLAQVGPSRLPEHRLFNRDAEARLRASLGQSLEDWLRVRFGRIGAVVDGVAFPETEDEVRDVLVWARGAGAIAIPVGGATSVVGHLTPKAGERPTLAIVMTRLRRLLNLDPPSQLATFEAGVAGQDLEAQLRAKGFMLGHYPQSFEYATLGGWIATRSSGQQSARYGRIEAMFAGGRIETPTDTRVVEDVILAPAARRGATLENRSVDGRTLKMPVAMNAEEAGRYARDGFLLRKGLLSLEEVGRFRDRARSQLEQESRDGSVMTKGDKEGKTTLLKMWTKAEDDQYGLLARDERMVDLAQDATLGWIVHQSWTSRIPSF